MLVLSRKKNESIVIDERIVITVVEIRGDKVRLGIEAPREVPVHRSEVHAAIKLEQTSAAHPETNPQIAPQTVAPQSVLPQTAAPQAVAPQASPADA